MIPFLDHILIEMEERFGSTHHIVVKLLGLIPASRESISSLQDVSKIYASDLPSPSVPSFEFACWKMFALSRKEISTLQETLQLCDGDRFPNIKQLLRIACTLPVTVCENECSHSRLKLLKTFLRSTMSGERLSSLALMKIHYMLTKNIDWIK